MRHLLAFLHISVGWVTHGLGNFLSPDICFPSSSCGPQSSQVTGRPHQQDGTGADGDAATLHIPRTDVDGQRARWAPPKLFLLELLRDAVFIWNKGGFMPN